MGFVVVAGGQTGVDRAALDVAVELGLAYRGWCPRGGLAEDLPRPPGVLARYPELRETPAVEPAVRTAWNVRDSDATAVLRLDRGASPGTELTVLVAGRLGRPLLVCDSTDVVALEHWLRTLRDAAAVNFAGPRESEQPGIYRLAHATLLRVLGQPGPHRDRPRRPYLD